MGDAVTAANLVDRLSAHRVLAGAPRDQLAWLASRGRLLDLAAGCRWFA
jgi:hypothetical protein